MNTKERAAELGARVQHTQKELARERELKKAAQARKNEINAAPEHSHTDFWCRECRRDFVALGVKITRGKGATTAAYYEAACPKGHRNWRYITDIWNDPYFSLSPKVKRDREKYADAMLTPDNPRFKTVYPDQWKALQARKQEYERQANTES